MSSLREDVTKTVRRIGRRNHTVDAARAETAFASDPREGKEYGSYRVLRRLGFGGMGQVYLSLDTRLGRHVALKFLDARLTSDPTMLERLYQEARTASSLNHPNILTIYEMGQAAGEHFIASEFVEGITVGDAIDRSLVTPKMAIEIATQVASALVAAHAAGIIHRDLKATNVMIRPDGLVKVIDFGLAKRSQERMAAAAAAGEHHRPLSLPGGVAGTVEYMSPEQTRGEMVDQRTDLWSLGVVLYEMLTGKFPFDGPTEGHVMVAIAEQATSPLENATSLPRGVNAILERSLTKEREKRYQSAGQMLLDLQNLGLTKQPVRAIKRFSVLAESKQLGRIAMTVAAFVATISAAAIWWFAFNGKERVLGPDWFEPGPPEQITFNGKVDFATISPDGKYLAYTSREDGKGILHIRNLDAKSDWQSTPYTDTTFGLTFAPDSKSLYYVLHDQREWGRLYNVNMRGGVPKILVDDIDGPVSFSRDGARFAFLRRFEDNRTSANKIILSSASDTGSQQEIVRKVGTFVGPVLAWSDKRNQIAAIVSSVGLHSSLRGSIFLYSPDGSTTGTSFSHPSIRSMVSPVWIPGTNTLALAAISDWRTGTQKELYEVSVSNGQFRAFSTSSFIDDLSTTRTGDILSAIQQTRKVAFWVAQKEALDVARAIVPKERIDTGGFDHFSWDDDDNLVVPAAQPHSLDLVRLSESGTVAKITSAQGCVAREPAYAPGKSLVVYVSNCTSLGNARNLWQIDLKDGKSRPLTAGLTRDEEPAVSPDGKWIVYTAWPSDVSSLWKLPIAGGNPQQISRIQAGHPAISPNGRSVLCQIRESYDGRYRYAILSLASGDVEKELWDLPITNVSPRWEPDGSAIDFLDSAETRIWRKPLLSGYSTPLTAKMIDPITDFSWNRAGNKLAFTSVHTNNDVVFFHRKTTN